MDFPKQSGDLRAVIAKIEESIHSMGLGPAAERQLRVDVGTINLQLGAEQPKHSIVHESLMSVKNILEGAAENAVAVMCLKLLTALGI
jgi:hypothetical protein